MNDLQISYFLKVAETGNISSAANELFVSQPAVSKQIKAMEQELGFLLFDRGKLMTLTSNGERLYMILNEYRRNVQDLVEEAAAEKEGFTTLRIGYLESWDIVDILSEIRDSFLEHHPDCHLHMEAYSFRDMITHLLSKRLDLVVSLSGNMPESGGLTWENVGKLQRVIVYYRTNPNASMTAPVPYDFRDQPLFLIDDDVNFKSSVKMNTEFCRSQGYEPQIHTLANRDTVMNAIAIEHGYTLFDKWSRAINQKGYLSSEVDSYNTVCIAQRPDRQHRYAGDFICAFRQFSKLPE